MVVRELVTRLGFEVDEKGIHKANAVLKELAGGILKFFTVAGAIAGVVELGKASLEAAEEAERIRTSFEMITGSAETAKNLMKDIGDFSSKATIPQAQLQTTAEKFLRAGIASKNIIPVMQMLGDAAGGNKERFDLLSQSFTRMVLKGSVSGRELIQMGQAAGPIYQVLGKQLGLSRQELIKLANSGGLSANQVVKAFETMTSAGGMFYKGMEKSAMTLSGMKTLIKNNFENMFEDLGNILMPLIKEVFQDVIPLIKPIGELLTRVFSMVIPILQKLLPIINRILTKVLDAVGRVLEALQPVIDVILGVLDDVLGPLIDIIIESGLMELINGMVPLFAMLAQEVFKVFKIMEPLFAIVLKIFGKEMQIYIGIFAKILSGVVKILPPIFNTINWILERIIPVVDWIFKRIDAAYDWLIKLLHLTKKAGKEQAGMINDMEKSVISAQKTMNLNMSNEFNINAQGGLTPSNLNSMMAEAARGTFALEIRKIMIAAMS